ncbi:ras-related protein RabX-like [Chironomus tepperi]|uniref:ras-related protein RabX-like n=1 Tax=Chironomus tepperi TaxID=113505 RepID=UPI00391F8C1D
MNVIRTPISNSNDEISEDDEIQREENLHRITNEMSNIIITSEDDDFQEFNQSQVVRSTSFVNNSRRSLNNNTIRPQPSKFSNNAECSSKIVNPQSNNPLFVSSPSARVRMCDVCKKDAKRHAFVCKGCKKICHPICLKDEEESSVECETESFVCRECMNIFNNLSMKINETPKINNSKNIPSKSSNTIRKNLMHNPEEEEEIISTAKYSGRNEMRYTANSSNNVHNSDSSNFRINNELESYIVKLQYNKLPTVVDSDLSWSVFYAAFTRTKTLFDPDENVIRVQAAIKDEDVKRIGGKAMKMNPILHVGIIRRTTTLQTNAKNCGNLMAEKRKATTYQNYEVKPEDVNLTVLESTSNEDDRENSSLNRNTNTISNNQNIDSNVTDVVSNLINNEFFTNVPESLREHLLNYQTSQRSSYMIANYSSESNGESNVIKNYIDTGSQTSIMDKIVKTYVDASTQTSNEFIKDPKNESTNIENNIITHDILYSDRQNEFDSNKLIINELPFNLLNLDVKKKMNDKFITQEIQKDEIVVKSNYKSLNPKLSTKMKVNTSANDGQ